MERAGRLIGKLRMPPQAVSAEDRARAAWPAAVGKRIAAHTRVTRLVRTTLVIEVEDAVWQRQLTTLAKLILSKLREVLGDGIVTDLDFRPMPMRRMPQRATTVRPPTDEADQIPDPVLRRLYVAARKKASA